MFRIFCLILLTFLVQSATAQSFRGLAPLNDSVCWVSGSKGTVLKTENGGVTWDTVSPPGYATKEFRDIHAYSPLHAVIMSSGDSAVVLSTRNGGKSWTLAHSNNRPGVFYDAMDAYGSDIVIIGDPYIPEDADYPIFDIQYSCDSGDSWECERFMRRWERAEPGEALFAASGTNIFIDYGYVGSFTLFTSFQIRYSFVTGGAVSRFFRYGLRATLPFDTCASCGAYSHFRTSKSEIVIVGGDYLKPDQREKTCVYYDKEKESFQFSETPPNGYRSCVAHKADSDLSVCTGTNGTDMSWDYGVNWSPLPLEGYNACAFTENYLWLCGDKGRVLRVLAPGR